MTENPSGADTYGLGDHFPSGGLASERMAQHNGASEFSWSYGLTPPGLEEATPEQGGRYCGATPPCEPTVVVHSR